MGRKKKVVTKLVVWDFNGSLLNDLQTFYDVGVCYIFRHFGLDPPSLEEYRNGVHSNFLAFYRAHGVPQEFSADELDRLVDESRAITPYDAELFHDAHDTLAQIQSRGIEQVIVSGCPQALLNDIVEAENLRCYFSEIRGTARDKVPVLRELLTARGLKPNRAVGLTDTDGDVAMLAEVGIKPYVCPRGFHGPERIMAASDKYPTMEIVPDLAAFLAKLR